MNIFNIYKDIEFSEKKVQITAMFESSSSKEIRIVFTKDQVMKDHKTAYPITVEIFEGTIDFSVLNEVYTLIKGDIVALDANIMHNLKAQENSIVRLSLNKSDSVKRVSGVLKL